LDVAPLPILTGIEIVDDYHWNANTQTSSDFYENVLSSTVLDVEQTFLAIGSQLENTPPIFTFLFVLETDNNYPFPFTLAYGMPVSFLSS